MAAIGGTSSPNGFPTDTPMYPGGPGTRTTMSGGGNPFDFGGGNSFWNLSSGSMPSRPTVTMPNRGDFSGGITPSTIAMPNRGDYTPATIAGPNAGDYGTPSAAGIDTMYGLATQAASGFNDPTHTSAFRDLMGLAQQQTGAAASEARREAADVAQRRGYAGGLNTTGQQAAIARMNALSTAGFQGAGMVRQQEGEQFGRAAGAFTSLEDAYNQAMTARNVAFGNAKVSTAEEQAKLNEEAGLAYAGAVSDRNRAQTQADLGFAGLTNQANIAYGDALSKARDTQAQLDEAYNSNLIDVARYRQMSASVQAQLAMEQARLGEQAREFNVTSGEQGREFDVTHQPQEFTANRNAPSPFTRLSLGPQFAQPATGIA